MIVLLKALLKLLILIGVFILMFYVTDSLNHHFRFVDSETFYILYAISVVSVVIGLIIRSLNKDANKIIPEHVGAESYIDSNGTIFLRSYNYETASGEEWVVGNNSISMKHNLAPHSVETIPFTTIREVSITNDNQNSIFKLAFSILETHSYYRGGYSVDRTELTFQPPITFKESDYHIAQAIHDRILSHTSQKS